jgi:cell division protein FtsN
VAATAPVAAPTAASAAVSPPPAVKPAPVAAAPAKAPAPVSPSTAAKPVELKPSVPKPVSTTAAPPARSPGGTYLVQIGAFSSAALADKGWNDAAALAPGAAAGKGKKVETVASGGKTLFRTSVTGFASRADADAFCSRLKAARKDCFVR